MLTPSSNTVLEPVTTRLVAALDATTAHFSRFRVTRISLDTEDLDQFDPSPMLAASRLLADAKVDVITWNGTSASWLGLKTDEKLAADIAAETGIAASTCILSLMDAMKRMGVRRYSLVSPYTTDVQDKIVDNFSRLGFELADERHFGLSDNFSFATVTRNQLGAAMRTVAAAKPDAILVLCTNLDGAAVAADIEAETGVPVLDSVVVTLWGALRTAGRTTAGLAPWGQALSRIQFPDSHSGQHA
jgi:maleate isomerase